MTEVKLSERLEAAVERMYEDGMDTQGIADLFRESAKLARRFEDAQIREVEEEMHGLVIRAYPLQKGQRVRVVTEQGEE